MILHDSMNYVATVEFDNLLEIMPETLINPRLAIAGWAWWGPVSNPLTERTQHHFSTAPYTGYHLCNFGNHQVLGDTWTIRLYAIRAVQKAADGPNIEYWTRGSTAKHTPWDQVPEPFELRNWRSTTVT